MGSIDSNADRPKYFSQGSSILGLNSIPVTEKRHVPLKSRSGTSSGYLRQGRSASDNRLFKCLRKESLKRNQSEAEHTSDYNENVDRAFDKVF